LLPGLLLLAGTLLPLLGTLPAGALAPPDAPPLDNPAPAGFTEDTSSKSSSPSSSARPHSPSDSSTAPSASTLARPAALDLPDEELIGEELLDDLPDDPVGRDSEAFASADLASGDLASGDLAFDAIGFFVALELLVLLGRSDLFVPTSYLFFLSTV
jgi:hypothetical protein